MEVGAKAVPVTSAGGVPAAAMLGQGTDARTGVDGEGGGPYCSRTAPGEPVTPPGRMVRSAAGRWHAAGELTNVVLAAPSYTGRAMSSEGTGACVPGPMLALPAQSARPGTDAGAEGVDGIDVVNSLHGVRCSRPRQVRRTGAGPAQTRRNGRSRGGRERDGVRRPGLGKSAPHASPGRRYGAGPTTLFTVS